MIRPTSEADVEGIRALYARLSEDDIYKRFFVGHLPPDSFVERWVQLAQRDGVGLVAAVRSAGEEIIAEAGYALLANGNGEFGLTVDPAWRGWLGPWLLDALVVEAHRRGVPNLEAEVLVRNGPMLAVIRQRGYAVADHVDWTTVRVVISTAGRVPSWPPAEDRPRLLVSAPGGRWEGEADAQDAGLSVVTCPGPDGSLPHCPALEGRPCPLVAGADALVIALPKGDPRTRQLVEEHRREHPDLPIVLSSAGDDAAHPCDATADLVEQLCATLLPAQEVEDP